MDHPAARNRVIPICGPQALSLREAADVCERLLGKPVTMRSFTAQQPPPGWPPLLVQLMLGCATDLFIDTDKAAREFGVRLTSLDEYVQKVLANAPVP